MNTIPLGESPANARPEKHEVSLDPPRPVSGKPGVFMFVSRNGDVLHSDEFRPGLASRVQQFIRETMRKGFPHLKEEEWPGEIVARLEKQFTTWAVDPPEPPKQPVADPLTADPRVDALARMPQDVRDEAAALLADPKLIERISHDIRAAGVVGEREMALALYLVGTSAQLAEPLAAVVRGPSSSGKSFLVETVASLFPPEVTLRATDLTQNALYYFKPGELRHRWVVAGERSRIEDDERAEATRALREMISAWRLSKAVALREGDAIVSRVVVQEGPIAFVETTTLEDIFAEDANRCLIFSTDERNEQTRRILNATAERATGRERPDLSRLQAVHHAIQRMLPRVGVVVPFAPDLSELLPGNRVEERRDLPKVLRLVQAAALLRHRQRERDEPGRVVAAIADYQLAVRLAADALGAVRSGLSDPARRCFELIRDQFGIGEFTSNQAESAAAKSRSSVRAWLTSLAKRGFLRQTEQAKGPNPAKWQLTGNEPETAASYLPTAEQVLGRYRGRTLGR